MISHREMLRYPKENVKNQNQALQRRTHMSVKDPRPKRQGLVNGLISDRLSHARLD